MCLPSSALKLGFATSTRCASVSKAETAKFPDALATSNRALPTLPSPITKRVFMEPILWLPA